MACARAFFSAPGFPPALATSEAAPPSSWPNRAESRCCGSMYWWSWPTARLCASARASCSLVVNLSTRMQGNWGLGGRFQASNQGVKACIERPGYPRCPKGVRGEMCAAHDLHPALRKTSTRPAPVRTARAADTHRARRNTARTAQTRSSMRGGQAASRSRLWRNRAEGREPLCRPAELREGPRDTNARSARAAPPRRGLPARSRARRCSAGLRQRGAAAAINQQRAPKAHREVLQCAVP